MVNLPNPLDLYVPLSMCIDAQRVYGQSIIQDAISHAGMRGRFRELLIDGMLTPWLPPSVTSMTGTVLSKHNHFRSTTQEDILLVDKQVAPMVTIKQGVDEGVVLRNSVLMRAEVKSNLRRSHIDDFVTSCNEFAQVHLDVDDERHACGRFGLLNINALFAYRSDISAETILQWVTPHAGMISMVCVANKGFWKSAPKTTEDISKGFCWHEYDCQWAKNTRFTEILKHPAEAERIAAFTAISSNTAFNQHILAQGRDRLASLESGVGHYFNTWRPV